MLEHFRKNLVFITLFAYLSLNTFFQGDVQKKAYQ